MGDCMDCKTLSQVEKEFFARLGNLDASLSSDAWAMLVGIVKCKSLPVTMCALRDGFGLEVYDHPKRITQIPHRILCLAEQRMPLCLPHQTCTDIDRAHKLAEILTHTWENELILGYYRMVQPFDPRSCCIPRSFSHSSV
jgi:hypothetical protein